MSDKMKKIRDIISLATAYFLFLASTLLGNQGV